MTIINLARADWQWLVTWSVLARPPGLRILYAVRSTEYLAMPCHAMISRDYTGFVMGLSVPEYARLLNPVCILLKCCTK